MYLRCPFSDAGQLSELNDGLLKRAPRTEDLWIDGNGRSESRKCVGPRLGHSGG